MPRIRSATGSAQRSVPPPHVGLCLVQPLVLFDLDNTLMNRQRSLAAWAARFCHRHGLTTESEAWLFALLEARATPAHFALVRDRFGLSDSAGTLWGGYCADVAGAAVCPPAVLSGLAGLRATGWRVGVLTNGAADIQRAKLRATGIVDCVDGVCISGETGLRKPDPAAFREAVDHCGPGRGCTGAWMIGDNPVADMGGGRAAGLRTIWVGHGVRWPAELVVPDHRVTNALAAIRLLQSFGK